MVDIRSMEKMSHAGLADDVFILTFDSSIV